MGRKKLKRKPEPQRRIRWPRWTGISGSTLRDWLPIVGALLIPLLIFYGTAQITQEQANSEAKRAEAERELAEQRAQDETLQAYFDQMSGLLLEGALRQSEEDSNVRRLARARTLVVLDTLDSARQNRVLRFLEETELIQARPPNQPPIISLKYASLRDFTLFGKQLLRDTDLTQAGLTGADLSKAHLQGTNLRLAHLGSANLRGAYLNDAKLNGAYLYDTDLRGADMRGADLSDAEGSFESGARMIRTRLGGADLRGADLGGAVLTNAVLTNAEVTEEQLREAGSLERATMPNGQKYEDWLKSKDQEENK